MRLNVLADTISTYLTLACSLILPVLLLVWVRSYMVSDRFYRAEAGLAVVAGVSHGEVAMWTGPTPEHVQARGHRSRETLWGWNTRRTFQRMGATEHFWLLGFGYAHSHAMPWRGVPLTGMAVAIVVPIWFPVLLCGAMPARLVMRNMQTSKDFLAQRAVDEVALQQSLRRGAIAVRERDD